MAAGQRLYSDIKARTQVDELYKNDKAALIRDETVYKRQLCTLLKTKICGDLDGVSDDLKMFVEYYDTITNGIIKRNERQIQFYQGEHEGIYYFYREDNLALLNGPVGLDGTFECVKSLSSRQMYVITTQVYSDDKTETMCLPVVCALLPSKTKVIYTKFLKKIKLAVLLATGAPWSPTLVTMDNEVGALLSVEAELGVIPITCYFHVSSAWVGKFKDYGFIVGINSTCPFVQEFYLDLKGLVLLDLRDEHVWTMAAEYLQLKKEQAVLCLDEHEWIKFHNLIDQYIIPTWFRAASPHFLPKWSNWWQQLLSGNNVITNNCNESQNASLKVLLRKGTVDYPSLVHTLHKWIFERNGVFKVFYDGNRKQKRGVRLLEKHRNMTHIARSFQFLVSQVSPQDSRQLFHEAIHKLGRVGYYASASDQWARNSNPVWKW